MQSQFQNILKSLEIARQIRDDEEFARLVELGMVQADIMNESFYWVDMQGRFRQYTPHGFEH
ncbi:hypothetical protein [Pseudomonas phage PH826]|uniref:Uncharacterized protein n=14 Tax=Nankokuvirus TaxID=1925779 RepID=A0A218L414_9CAUD|nr:hypothetical protein [Pseudomonas aeruginosa]YP_004306791.1 hypothetical protein KPP10_gp042 [Pseudomonas phage KPP10]YP_008856922.1 hypothetical protein X832_gp046 [Pseudomonas phage PAK_P5]YP_008857680.1 hypothetical protein PAK_P30045 [Pseudomonas phage PAK_P3]YP_008858069.1 hypothetical protein X837_gp046 [Pseudomonas phage CHA_P1]YP_009124497.1 hypothetical protein VC54_gp110 [Pseudomonas phage vB_PaeM_PAO1_Ab03]YP_009206057.1 hypothetical protein AVT15_gp109 [Pseudomonas phage vB_Pae